MSKILIVEDEESIAELEKDYLELSGFEVEIENRGDTGLERALKEEFDLFILDLMLPGTDGFEICKRIRQVKNTPILMVSAKKDDIDKIRGLGLGADDYITKPFSPSELVARVKAHLSRYDRLIGSGSTPERDHRDPRTEDRQDRPPCLYQRRGEELHYQGIRPADLPRAEPESRIHEGRALHEYLGNGIRRRYRNRNRTYQEDSREDRVRYLEAAVHRNYLGSRLSL